MSHLGKLKNKKKLFPLYFFYGNDRFQLYLCYPAQFLAFLREQENLTLGLLITLEVYIRVAQVTCHGVI